MRKTTASRKKDVMISLNPEYAVGVFMGKMDYILMRHPILLAETSPLKAFIYVSSPMQEVMGEAKLTKVTSKVKAEDVSRRAWIGPSEVSTMMAMYPNIYKLTCVKEYDKWYPVSDYGMSEAPKGFAYCRERKSGIKKKKE